SSNFGSSSTLESDTSPMTESYIKFRIPELKGKITGAKLRLYVTNKSKQGPTIAVAASNWSESTVTYNSRPSILKSAIATSKDLKKKTYVEYDVLAGITNPG